jgi:hypothetical protein
VLEIVLNNGVGIKVDKEGFDRLGVYRWYASPEHRFDRVFSEEVNCWMGWRKKNVEWAGRVYTWRLNRMLAGVPRFFRYYPRSGDWHDARFENIGLRDWKGNEYVFKKFTGHSVFKGVKWDGYYGLWRSEICGLVIGYYWNEVDSARAYNVKYKEIFPEGREYNSIPIMVEWLKNNKRSRKAKGVTV